MLSISYAWWSLVLAVAILGVQIVVSHDQGTRHQRAGKPDVLTVELWSESILKIFITQYLLIWFYENALLKN